MKKAESMLSRFINTLSSVFGNASIVSLVAVGLLVNAAVIMRYVFNAPFHFTEEISGYLMVALVFLGLADTLRAERHIRIDVVFVHLPKWIQNTLEICSLALGLIFAGIFAWRTGQTVLTSYQIKMTSFGLWQVPLYLPQLLMPIGFVALALQIIARAIKKIQGFRS